MADTDEPTRKPGIGSITWFDLAVAGICHARGAVRARNLIARSSRARLPA